MAGKDSMAQSLTADQVIEMLGMKPLPVEGGYYAETHRSGELPASLIAETHPGPRSYGTAIYYLLTPDTLSAMHRLPGPEIYHHYLGDPAELVVLSPDGNGQRIILGHNLLAGQRPQFVVPGGAWQGSILLPGDHGFALMGTTMSPGYDFADNEPGDQAALTTAYPAFSAAIAARIHQTEPPSN